MNGRKEVRLGVRRVASSQRNLITRAQARSCGLSDDAIGRLVRSGEWVRIVPRVFSTGASDPRWQQEALAVCLAGGPAVAASHTTAAALWELDGIQRVGLAATSRTKLRLGLPGLVVHRTSRVFVVHRARGIPVTTVARTLLDLGAVVAIEPLQLAVEDALRRRLTSTTKLRQALAAEGGAGRPGSKALSRLLGSNESAVTESSLEVKILRALDRHGLPPPVRQHPLTDPDGARRRIDLAYPNALLAIEVQSYRWHSGRDAWSRDITRINALTRAGWTVLLATKEDLCDGGRRLAQAVRDRLRGLADQPTLVPYVRPAHIGDQSPRAGDQAAVGRVK